MGNLSDLAGLSAVQQVDFTAAGLSGTVPASWATGAWSGSLLSLVLAQNPQINGSVPDISGYASSWLAFPLNAAVYIVTYCLTGL